MPVMNIVMRFLSVGNPTPHSTIIDVIVLLCKTGLQQLFEDACDLHPNHVAVIGPSHDDPSTDIELTYSQLDAKANQVCYYLMASKGVRPATTVAIFLERSTTFYTAMLAVLKCGAAYVALDPDSPNDRIDYILRDSGAITLITTTSLTARLSSLWGLHLVYMDSPYGIKMMASQKTTRPSFHHGFDNDLLCYVKYTSGSSDRPNGVPVSHAAALNFIQGFHHQYPITPQDRSLQGCSPSLDISVAEMWNTFASGATLVVGTKAIMRSGRNFPKLMRKYGITWLSITPTHLMSLEEDLETVTMLTVGGEACPRELVKRWCTPNRRLINAYGQSEATVYAACKECQPDMTRMTVGRPMPNYRCFILDEHMNLLPPGAIGELVIGGISVSEGYLNLMDKTEEAFKPDTLSNGPYNLYKTGDLARFGADGEFEHLGRIDCQVRIRGYRVELTEVESVLCEHPKVNSAVVAAQMVNGMKHLVAFIIPAAKPIDILELTTFLSTKLPSYMMPSAIEIVEDFPTSPSSGKVDRRRLPQVAEKRLALVPSNHPAQTAAPAWDEAPGANGMVAVPEEREESLSMPKQHPVSHLRPILSPLAAAAKDTIHHSPKMGDFVKLLQSVAMGPVRLPFTTDPKSLLPKLPEQHPLAVKWSLLTDKISQHGHLREMMMAGKMASSSGGKEKKQQRQVGHGTLAQ